MKRCLFVLLTLLIGLPGPALGDGLIDRTIATVGGQALTLSDYRNEYNTSTLTERRLRLLVENMAVQVLGKRHDIKIPSGLDGAHARRYHDQKLIRALFNTEPNTIKVKARLLVFRNPRNAQQAFRVLRQNRPDSAWGRLYEQSAKPGIAGDNGQLGWIKWGRFHPAIEYRLYTAKTGAITPPFSVRGFSVILQKQKQRIVPELDPQQNQRLRRFEIQRLRPRLYRKAPKRIAVVYPDDIEATVLSGKKDKNASE